MKILNVNMSINTLFGGGTAERTFQMTKHLSKKGIECAVLTLDLGLTPEILKALNKVEILDLPYISKRFFVPRFSFNSFKKINDIIAGVDIIHIIGHWSIINAVAYVFARYFDKPYVYCPAGTVILSGRSKLLKRLYNLIIGKSIIRSAHGYISITADDTAQMRPYGVNNHKIFNISNAVNSEDFLIKNDLDFRRKYKLGNHPFILFVGTFSSIKGPDLLLKSFHSVKNRFPSYHLVYAGTDRGMLSELKMYTTKYNMEGKVHFVGYLGSTDKSMAYHAADLLVVPSRHEAMSMVALEAGITATPVLLTDQCGFGEISNIGGGKIVPATVNGLGKGLIEMLSNPKELKYMGTNLKKYITLNHSWDIIVNKYIELFNSVLIRK